MKQPDWIKWSAVAEILSAIAIVVTLIYLSVQTQQNSSALLAVSRQATLQGDMAMFAATMAYPEDLNYNNPELSPAEVRNLTMRIMAMRTREFAWLQYQSEILDESTWLSYMAPMRSMFDSETGRTVLNLYTGIPEFKAYVIEWLDAEPDGTF